MQVRAVGKDLHTQLGQTRENGREFVDNKVTKITKFSDCIEKYMGFSR